MTIKNFEHNIVVSGKDFKDAKIGSKIYLLSSKILKDNLDQGLNSYKNLPLDIKFEAKIGKYPKITLQYNDTKISYEGESLVEEGKNISLEKNWEETKKAKNPKTIKFMIKEIVSPLTPFFKISISSFSSL